MCEETRWIIIFFHLNCQIEISKKKDKKIIKSESRGLGYMFSSKKN